LVEKCRSRWGVSRLPCAAEAAAALAERGPMPVTRLRPNPSPNPSPIPGLRPRAGPRPARALREHPQTAKAVLVAVAPDLNRARTQNDPERTNRKQAQRVPVFVRLS